MSFGGLGVREKKPIFYDQIVFFGDFTNIYLWRRNLKHRSFGFLMEVLRSESEVTCTMVYPQKIKTWYHKKSISIKEILIFCKAHPLLVSKLLPMGARLCSASQTSKPLWSCQGVTLTVCHVWYPTSSNRSCFGCFPHSSPHPLVTWGHDAR